MYIYAHYIHAYTLCTHVHANIFYTHRRMGDEAPSKKMKTDDDAVPRKTFGKVQISV